jgi:hypothetical protein
MDWGSLMESYGDLREATADEARNLRLVIL